MPVTITKSIAEKILAAATEDTSGFILHYEPLREILGLSPTQYPTARAVFDALPAHIQADFEPCRSKNNIGMIALDKARLEEIAGISVKWQTTISSKVDIHPPRTHKLG